MIVRFNVRAYFILFDESWTNVLLSDEYIQGKNYTKFPGGGVELGEGITDALHREAMEELGQDIELTGHFYTTEYFVASLFRSEDQMISVYYTAQLKGPQAFTAQRMRFQFENSEKSDQAFRWFPLKELTEDEMSFPIDKTVVTRLKNELVSF
jgi:8-oxo-dGTP diphosphatase